MQDWQTGQEQVPGGPRMAPQGMGDPGTSAEVRVSEAGIPTQPEHTREVWVLPQSHSPVFAGQVDSVGPAVADDGVLWLVVSDVPFLKQYSNCSTVESKLSGCRAGTLLCRACRCQQW